MKALAEIKNLTIGFQEGKNLHEAVKDISFNIYEGEILGVVGESGSGKSMSALALMGLLPKEARVLNGEIYFNGAELLSLKTDERRKIQGKEMAMVFQEPMTSLNPVLKIEKQVGEILELHTGLSGKEIHEKVIQSLHMAGLSDAEELCKKYPHELSGGMRQRVMLAQAMIASPKLLIADEPTTALDVIVQAQILRLLKQIHKEQNISILFISHDLNVIKDVCDRVLVVYKGSIVERGNAREVLKNPRHEYTKKLIASIPKHSDVSGTGNKLLDINHLDVYYDNRQAAFWKKKTRKHIIHDVNLTVYEGEIFGIVGESGCGKSTLSKAVLGLNPNYSGQIELANGLRPQMVFQDPFSSLNPARKIGWILEEPLKLRGIRDKQVRKQMVADMLKDVGLEESYAGRYARELSGGQRQRISIGTALLMDSRLIIADEPVSALDVTVQSQILNLLLKLHKEKKLTIIFISHDLKIIRQICHRVAVLYLGEIVEMGDVEKIYCSPSHPYTKLLLKAVLDDEMDEKGQAAGEIGEHSYRGLAGCPFYPRCSERKERCKVQKPDGKYLDENHFSKCWGNTISR